MVNSNKNNRGQVLVLVAISLVVLIGFAALAIDIGYFYHTKNQLQGAADAAALAGAAKLNGTNDLIQTDARNEAITYALLNSASGSSVHLSSDGSNVLANDNGINDITVGYWVANTYTAGGTPVNAVQVKARSTNKDAAGFPRIFGKIFDNTKQEIRPEAIAARPPRASINISLCAAACTSCVSAPCILSSPRILEMKSSVPDSQIAWTSLTQTSVTSASNEEAMICGPSPFVDNCNDLIWSTNGVDASVLKDMEYVMYDPTYESNKKEFSGTTIIGWTVLAPVISASECPPGTQSDPKKVVYYANIHIKAVCVSGNNTGCGSGSKGYNAKDNGPANVCKDPSDPKGKADYPDSIIIDSIQCFSCDDPIPKEGYKAVLVK